MKAVEIRSLSKGFGSVRVIDGLDLTIGEGKFVSLLGPSGCGKTTTLRMIAGLEEPDAGEILIGGSPVSAPAQRLFVPPEKRQLGMVFQSYALWPHMTVGGNVGYPLKLRGVDAVEIDRRVNEALHLVHLGGLGNRLPHELSGGQQQRVALARALVLEPKLLLLDEPLSNLDAALREELRFEIKDLQLRLGIGVILVTHDQAEAFAVSDLIVLMHKGKILQAGGPADLYAAPHSPFAASFLGVANTVSGVMSADRRLRAGDPAVELDLPMSGQPGQKVQLVVRPQDLALDPPDAGAPRGIVERVTFLGDRIDYRVKLAGQDWRISALPPARFAAGQEVTMRVTHGSLFPES